MYNIFLKVTHNKRSRTPKTDVVISKAVEGKKGICYGNLCLLYSSSGWRGFSGRYWKVMLSSYLYQGWLGICAYHFYTEDAAVIRDYHVKNNASKWYNLFTCYNKI